MGKKNQIKTCYDRDRCKCKHHGRKCGIPVSFPQGDDRNRFIAEMRGMGVTHHHTKDSTHRCDLCDRERQEGRRSGWYQIDPVDGKVKAEIVLERLTREREEKEMRIKRNQKKRKE